MIDAIYARRATRAYTPQKVSELTIRSLLEAAVQAPSAMNDQPWAFAIVQDAARLKRYSDRAKAMLLETLSASGASDASDNVKTRRYETMLRDDHFNVFYDATTLIVIGAVERGPYRDADCWLAAQNLMLAATDAGLGTCPIGFAVPLLNTREVKEELCLPEAGTAVAPIIVGYASATPPAVPRREPRIVSWSH
jgi:nitroreductase